MEVKVNHLYRHFKGMLYIVEDIVYHSETQEKMVLYRALYGERKLWVRPYDMFISKVDKEKYKEVKEEYSFTLIEDNQI